MEHYILISKKRKASIICLTFLLHLLLLLLFFHHYVAHKDHAHTMPSPLDDDDIYMVQQLLSSGQQEPATVLFQDDAPSGEALPEKQEALETDLEELHTPKEMQQEEAPDEKPEEPGNDAPQDEPIEEEVNIAPLLEEVHAAPAMAAPQKKAPPKPKIKRIRPREKTTNKQQITFADISHGFIKSMHQEAGYNQATKDMRQLSLQVYTSKVWHLIKQSFLAGDNSIHMPHAVDTQTQLLLEIDRTGKLLHIQLLYPPQIPELRKIEQLIIKRSQQAGLFPPFPPHIKANSKVFCFPLHVSGQEGVHNYSMSYR